MNLVVLGSSLACPQIVHLCQRSLVIKLDASLFHQFTSNLALDKVSPFSEGFPLTLAAEFTAVQNEDGSRYTNRNIPIPFCLSRGEAYSPYASMQALVDHSQWRQQLRKPRTKHGDLPCSCLGLSG